MGKSIWDSRRPRPEPVKNYESNAERLLEFGAINPGPRALRAMRVEQEVRKAKETRRLPTVAEIQGRYPFTDESARQFIKSVERALKKAAAAKAARTAPAAKSSSHLPLPALQPTPVQLSEPSPAYVAPVAPFAALAAVLADIRRRFGDEIRTKGEQTAVREGFVYLLVHPCFEGWVKAGMTIDYELRLASYNTSDPLSRFAFVSAKWVPDRRRAERLLLDRLANVSGEMRGEWARVAVSDAVAALTGL